MLGRHEPSVEVLAVDVAFELAAAGPSREGLQPDTAMANPAKWSIPDLLIISIYRI
jgi:hypothetical protein